MRWLALTGLLLVSCGLPPQGDPVDSVPRIFIDFPELARWGRVVEIGGREYWQPDPATLARVHGALLADPWRPYGSGYFYEDALDGLVWVSFEPWGFITDHYGYWRHHEQLGYVWRPMEPITWFPFVATILHADDGSIQGMCPFYLSVWEAGRYDLGFGFDDSYWAPYWSRASVHGFYVHHEPRFAGYCVGVTFYDTRRHHRDQPESSAEHEREYRRRREGGDSRDSRLPAQGRGHEEPSQPVSLGKDLPARPATTPSAPESPGDDGSVPGSGGHPSIPPRSLDPRPAREKKEPPPLPLERDELRPVDTAPPARKEPTPPAPEPIPTSPEPKRPLPDLGLTPKRAAVPTITPSPRAPMGRPAQEPPASGPPPPEPTATQLRPEPRSQTGSAPASRPAPGLIAPPDSSGPPAAGRPAPDGAGASAPRDSSVTGTAETVKRQAERSSAKEDSLKRRPSEAKAEQAGKENGKSAQRAAPAKKPAEAHEKKPD